MVRAMLLILGNISFMIFGASLVAQPVRNLPAV